MNKQDLEWLLAFAKSHSLMKESITVVLPLWLKDLEDYYNDILVDNLNDYLDELLNSKVLPEY